MQKADQERCSSIADSFGDRRSPTGWFRRRRELGIGIVFVWLAGSAALATDWRSLESAERCVGGERCGRFSALRFELEARPVEALRFEAHDDIGSSFEGRVRIRIDGQVIVEALPVDREARPFRIGASALVGRILILEPASDDEVVIRSIEVGYADRAHEGQRREGDAWRERTPHSSSEGWEQSLGDERPIHEPRRTDLDLRGWGQEGGESRLAFLEEVGCLGGMHCRSSSITVRFRRNVPVGEIRFFAHDNLGQTTRGRLRVLLDGKILADDLDIPAAGRTFTLSGGGRIASRLTFEPVSNDEILVKDLVVEAAQDRNSGPVGEPYRELARTVEAELPTGTWCLGGDACGRRWSLEIPLGAGVSALRFFASADIGRGFGRLKLVAGRGDLLSEWTIDRRGDFFEVEVPEGIGVLYMEVVEGDVMIEEVELRYAGGWERFRGEDDG